MCGYIFGSGDQQQVAATAWSIFYNICVCVDVESLFFFSGVLVLHHKRIHVYVRRLFLLVLINRK